MFKRIALALVLAVAIISIAPQVALAADPIGSASSAVCSGVSGTLGGSCGAGNGSSIQKIVKMVVNILCIVGGVAAVIMIIVGGLKYITSGGDSQAVGGAKKTIIYAVVGLIVISVAQLIVRFVLNSV